VVAKLNYLQDTQINPNELDVEWLKHANLVAQYALATAAAERSLKLLKEKIAGNEAELRKSIRQEPERFGILKLTEGAIQEVVDTDQQMSAVRKEYIELQYNHEVISGALRAMQAKGEALKNLVTLLGMEYFAGPKQPRVLNDFQKKADADVVRHMKGRDMKTGKPKPPKKTENAYDD